MIFCSCWSVPDFPSPLLPLLPLLPLSPIAGISFNNQIYIDDNTGNQGFVLQNGIWIPTCGFLGYTVTATAVIKAPFPDNTSISLLVIGGLNSENTPVNQWVLLTTNGWTLQPLLQQEFSNHCALLYNSTTILVIGGIYAPTDIFVFNSVTMEWTTAAKLNFAREDHYCAMISSSNQSQAKIPLVIGGSAQKSTEFSLDLSSWALGPALPYFIKGTAVVSDGNGGVVMVGGQVNSALLDTLLYLRHAQSHWEEMSIKLKTPKAYVTAIYLPDVAVNCG